MFSCVGCGYLSIGFGAQAVEESLSEDYHLAVLVEADRIGEAVLEAWTICRTLKDRRALVMSGIVARLDCALPLAWY